MNRTAPLNINWFRSRLLFPLAVASSLALAMFYSWPAKYGEWTGPRLQLNLALAWAPYIFALCADRWQETHPGQSWLLWPLLLLWFVFFPNAPYIITDWLYLPNWTDELWFGIGMMTLFAMSGMLLSMVSLDIVQRVVRNARGPFEGWLIVMLAIGLGGVGVFLGRFVRLNSWYLFTKPTQLWNDLVERMPIVSQEVRPFAFSMLFSGLLAVYYMMFRAVRYGPRPGIKGYDYQ